MTEKEYLHDILFLNLGNLIKFKGMIKNLTSISVLNKDKHKTEV